MYAIRSYYELLLDAAARPVDGLAHALARGLTCEVLTGDRVAFTAVGEAAAGRVEPHDLGRRGDDASYNFV